MLKKLERNIKLVYGLAFFHSFLVIVPVIVPFFMSKGLSLSEIFYLQSIYALSIVLLEAPSGYFADVLGRRFALLIGGTVHGFAYLYLNMVDGFIGLMFFEIAAGMASSMLSGADLAILYDSQKAMEEKTDSEPHSLGIARLGFVKSGAEGLGALLGGVLALYSFELMVLIQSMTAWVCLVLALFIVEPPYRDSRQQVDVRIIAILRYLLKGDVVLRNIFFAIPVYNLMTFHVAWLVQPFWEEKGVSLAAFGLLWFTQSLVTGLAARYSFVIERKHGAIFALTLIGVLPILGHFGMAWLNGWNGIAICLLLFFGRGLSQVILVNALNRRIPSEFRATANSLTSFTFRLAFITTGPIIGYVAESMGLPTALNLLGAASIVLFVLIMLPLIRSVQGLQRVTA